MLVIEKREPDYQDENTITFKGIVAGMECIILFRLIDDKLYSGAYLFTTEYSNKNEYIDDFIILKDLLWKKYGEPTNDDIIWKQSLYKNDAESWGLAISRGYLEYIADWETNTTSIHLSLTGNNYEIHKVLLYISKELEKEAESEKEKSILEDL